MNKYYKFKEYKMYTHVFQHDTCTRVQSLMHTIYICFVLFLKDVMSYIVHVLLL